MSSTFHWEENFLIGLFLKWNGSLFDFVSFFNIAFFFFFFINFCFSVVDNKENASKNFICVHTYTLRKYSLLSYFKIDDSLLEFGSLSHDNDESVGSMFFSMKLYYLVGTVYFLLLKKTIFQYQRSSIGYVNFIGYLRNKSA